VKIQPAKEISLVTDEADSPTETAAVPKKLTVPEAF
jgi:hypothetical protein